MEIVIKLPDEVEGTVEIDNRSKEIRIRPRFFKNTVQQTILYLETRNDLGASRKGTVAVKSTDGTYVTTNQKAPEYVAPAFDKVTPDGNAADKDKGVPTAGGAGGSGKQVDANTSKS